MYIQRPLFTLLAFALNVLHISVYGPHVKIIVSEKPLVSLTFKTDGAFASKTHNAHCACLFCRHIFNHLIYPYPYSRPPGNHEHDLLPSPTPATLPSSPSLPLSFDRKITASRPPTIHLGTFSSSTAPGSKKHPALHSGTSTDRRYQRRRRRRQPRRHKNSHSAARGSRRRGSRPPAQARWRRG